MSTGIGSIANCAPDDALDRRSPRTDQSGWRILHVEDDEVDALRVKLALSSTLPASSTVDHVCSLEQADDRLHQKQYDAVVVGLSCADRRSSEGLQALTAKNEETPILILSGDEDSSAALVAGRCGARDFLFKSRLSGEDLSEALRKAIMGTAHASQNAFSERRQDPRYSVELPAVIVPIQTDGNPGGDIAANTIDISKGGIGLLAAADSESVPDLCLVGVECRDGIYRYATVQWRHRRLALPAVRFGGRFLRRADDPFHETKLTPRFDPNGLRYRPSMAGPVLREWANRGILRSELIDRVKVCPQCEALPTFRNGCPQCGSAMTDVSRLVHHFACAHIAPLPEFGEDSLVCPKCQVQNLVVGADFEYLDGPHQCSECDWSGSEPSVIAECMQCGHRFPSAEAIEKDVHSYYVDRLDPLALIENR